jgi:soluble lytic murein transglycosylase-like protein
MHPDPRDSQDEFEPAASTPEGEPAELTRIPPPLRNWQVLDAAEHAAQSSFARKADPDPTDEIYRGTIIDGEARIIRAVDSASTHGEEPVPGGLLPPIRDHVDEFVAAQLPARRLVVTPGEAVELVVEVANQGRWAALFEVSLEGWIDESWCADLPGRVHLEPGMRRSISLVIAPPRTHTCRAGEHPMAVVVRAARYPNHLTRLAAVLVVEPYIALKVGTPQPREVRTSWFSPAATLHLPLHNEGNSPATVHVQGADAARQVDFTFLAGSAAFAEDHAPESAWAGSAQIVLGPGQSVSLPVEVRPRRKPLIGLTAQPMPLRFVARVATEPPLRRTAEGVVAVAPLIGPWQMAIGGVLMIVALFGTGLAGLALLVALRSAAAGAPAPQPVPVATPAPPAVTFVIQMNQPVPTPGAAPAALPGGEAATGDLVVTQPQAEVRVQPSVAPVVRADQITAPGQPTPAGMVPLRPLAGAAQSDQPVIAAPNAPPPNAPPAASAGSDMTYGQMFQAVAQQVDLDWRMLAAVAYLESGFDSLALSNQGDMGLMQIRPGTWHEFAPKVDASDPFDAYSNVQVGAVYLDYLRTYFGEQGHGEAGWMLVAYNWGPDKVMDHLNAGGTWDSLSVDRRQYAEDVLRIAASIPVP